MGPGSHWRGERVAILVCRWLGFCITGVFSALQVMILITGAHKAFALYKAIEEGVNHMWTVSAFQQHPRTVFVCDEDATLELKVKTVKYFKGEGREGLDAQRLC